jgi:hypothetical protein
MKPVLVLGTAMVAFHDYTWQEIEFELTEDDLDQSALYDGTEGIYDLEVEDAMRIKLQEEYNRKNFECAVIALYGYELQLEKPLVKVNWEVDFGHSVKHYDLELSFLDFQDNETFCDAKELDDTIILEVALEALFENDLQDYENSQVSVSLSYEVVEETA